MSRKAADPDAAKAASSRQWIRIVGVYLLIALTLFICGGDIVWWQAWLYALLVFVAGVGGRMWAEQRHPGLMAERQSIESIRNAKTWDRVLAPLMAVSMGFPMVIVAGLDHRNNWSPEFPLCLTVPGFLMISAGYVFAAWAMAENRFFSSVVRIQADRGHVVCDTGPYRYVRHPGYAGSIPPLFGIVLALGSVWALIPAAFALSITVTRAVLEDRALREGLPGYKDYARRVRFRLLPGVF